MNPTVYQVQTEEDFITVKSYNCALGVVRGLFLNLRKEKVDINKVNAGTERYYGLYHDRAKAFYHGFFS